MLFLFIFLIFFFVSTHGIIVRKRKTIHGNPNYGLNCNLHTTYTSSGVCLNSVLSFSLDTGIICTSNVINYNELINKKNCTFVTCLNNDYRSIYNVLNTVSKNIILTLRKWQKERGKKTKNGKRIDYYLQKLMVKGGTLLTAHNTGKIGYFLETIPSVGTLFISRSLSIQQKKRNVYNNFWSITRKSSGRCLEELINLDTNAKVEKKRNSIRRKYKKEKETEKKVDTHKWEEVTRSIHRKEHKNNAEYKVEYGNNGIRIIKLLKSIFLDGKNPTNMPKGKNNLLKNIEHATEFIENSKTTVKAATTYFLSNQTFIRSKKTKTTLKIKGNGLDNFIYKEILIFDSFENCEGNIITSIAIEETTAFHILTKVFEINELGTFTVCIVIDTPLPVALLNVQNKLIQQIESLSDTNSISTFNCSMDDYSILIPNNNNVVIVKIDDSGNLSQKSKNIEQFTKILPTVTNILACSSSLNYIALLDVNVVFIFSKDLNVLHETIVHHLTNPIGIFLDKYIIYITDADRKNIFQYKSKHIYTRLPISSEFQNKSEHIKLEKKGKTEGDKEVKYSWIKNTNDDKKKGENIEVPKKNSYRDLMGKIFASSAKDKKLDLKVNDNNLELSEREELFNLLKHKTGTVHLNGLMPNYVTLVYPAGIVVEEEKVYFVDSVQHVLFCYSLEEKKIIHTFGYLNSPIMSNIGLNKPFSLSLFIVKEKKKSLLFLSELSSSTILIFEINNSIKLYLTYSDIALDIATSIVVTSKFLIVCGLKRNKENYVSYVTYIKIEELSELEIEYNLFSYSLHYGQMVRMTPLKKSSNITTFALRQYDGKTNEDIDTGLSINKYNGIISGKIKISAWFHMEIKVYDYFNEKILRFKNFVSMCAKGFFFKSKICVPCPVGYYSVNTDKLICSNCEKHKKHSTTSYSGSINKNECLCKPGYYLKSKKQCEKCPAGYYKDKVGDFKCQYTCEHMKISVVEGATSYEGLKCACKDGYYTDNKSKCIICPINHYCIYNPKNLIQKADIIHCQENAITLTRGSSSPKECVCAPGYYYDENAHTCKQCEYNTFKQNGGNKSCTPFITNPVSTQKFLPNENYFEHSNVLLRKTTNDIFSPKRGSFSFTSAKLCETGYFYSHNKSICSICRYNGYCRGLYEAVTACPKNSFTVKLKSVTPLDCLCEKGYGRVVVKKPKFFDIFCVPCPYDTFQQHHSYGECIPCPAHTFTISTASTSITDCLPKNGYYSLYFQYIYEYSKNKLIQNIPRFLQQYRQYLNDQYKKLGGKYFNIMQQKGGSYNDLSNYDATIRDYTNNICYPTDNQKDKEKYVNKKEDLQKDHCKVHDKWNYANGYKNASSRIKIPKIQNNIRNLKGMYNNVFHTCYLKNVILMDRSKIVQFIQQKGSIFSLANSQVENSHSQKIQKNKSYPFQRSVFLSREDKKVKSSKYESSSLNNEKNTILKIHNKGEALLDATDKIYLEEPHQGDTSIIPTNLREVMMRSYVRKFNAIVQNQRDIVTLIKTREETYIDNKQKEIIYTCYEIDREIVLEKNVYMFTIPELDLKSCLNACISNMYCTGIEMNRTTYKGRKNLFFLLNTSYGRDLIHYYKCNLYLYEEITSYYEKENIKKIENIHNYDDSEKITGCTIKKNETLNLWRVYALELCPNNYYCNKKSFKKRKCPLNSVKNSSQGTINNCLCSPGYAFQKNLNSCTPCEKGTYKSSKSNDKCKKCPLNLTTISEASNSIYDCICREGYYFEGNFNVKLVDTKIEQKILEAINKMNKNEILFLPSGGNKVKDSFFQMKSIRRKNIHPKKRQAVLSTIPQGMKEKTWNGKKESWEEINIHILKNREIIASVKDTNFIQTEHTPRHIFHTTHSVEKHNNRLINPRVEAKIVHGHTENLSYGMCTKCPDKMFCPGFWLKKFERELHHPPIFCPKGSTIPKTTLESTDINKCICGKGYSINVGNNNNNGSNNELCVKCKERYYKDVVDNSPCSGLCMESSTSFHGSINKKQCFCSRGSYMIHESSLEMKCVHCPKGALCIGGLKYQSLKKLIKDPNYTDIEINDHIIPFPQKGYFATLEIKHVDFSWSPLNSLNQQINNYEKSDIIIKKKNIKMIFGKRIKYITLDRKRITNEQNNNKEIKSGNKIELDYYTVEEKNTLDKTGTIRILVDEKLEKLKYKNEYLTVDRIPDFHLCPISKRCIGGVDNLCYQGSEGYLCNNCSDNYDITYFRSQCFKCKKAITELLNLLVRKIFFYMIIIFIAYLNYFCYIKRNLVFIGIFKIWYFFIICFLPYVYVVESKTNLPPNYLLYFEFFITLPMRFITHYFKLNCFVNYYSNKNYISIWYIQRFIKIAEPMIDCFLLTIVFFLFYLIYTHLNRERITKSLNVITKQINQVHTNGYNKHLSNFYYHYYQKNVIDTINSKNKKDNFSSKIWDKIAFTNKYSSGEDTSKRKKSKHKEKKEKKEKNVNKKKTTTKNPLHDSSMRCDDSTQLTTSEDFSSSKNFLKKKLSYSNENMYNFDEELLMNETSNCSMEENITKGTYWTYMCSLNIYNIMAFGLFRYIHPPNISTCSKIKRIISDLKVIYIIILYIYFPFTVINLLELVWCQPVKYKNKPPILILYHMPSQVCDWRNKLFVSGLIFSFFFFLIYIFLFIMSLYGTLKNFKVFGSYAKSVRSYFLFNGYNYQNRCWDFFNIVKVIFVAFSFTCQLHTKRSNNSKYFICCCVVFVLITEVTLILMYSPYDKRSNDILRKLSLLSTFSILITYLSVQFSFFFNFYIINILPFILFFYFHIYMFNKIVLEFAIYKNILMKIEEKKNQPDEENMTEGLLNDQSFINFSKQKSKKTWNNIDDHVGNSAKKGECNNGFSNGREVKFFFFNFCYPSIMKHCNLFDFLLRVNNIPSYSIFFNEKEEEIFVFKKGCSANTYEEIANNIKMNTIKRSQTGAISLDLLHSDLLYYNIRESSKHSNSNINVVNLKKSNTNWLKFESKKRLSKKFENFMKKGNNVSMKNISHLNGSMNTENSEHYDTQSINITHFTNCLIEAINILFVNQSYNQITVEWISFVTRFSICFIHWMKKHDEKLTNFVPINTKQFEVKKRNLLFYSLFSSYAEMYTIYPNISNNKKFEECKKKFIEAENLEQFYLYLNESNNMHNIEEPRIGSQSEDEDKSESYTPWNFLGDEFFRCEHDIVKMLFDESVFKNLSISIVEFFFAIYMIQFIESKRLSILIFLFCEKKKYLNNERQFLKMIEARKMDIQYIMCTQDNNLMYDFVEYNYLNEYNQNIKKKIKKLKNLIKKKENSFVKHEQMKIVACAQKDKINRMSNANAFFVQTLKRLLDDSSIKHVG
ncbi:cysteine repeat modular protein 3 [Plasmodium gonderi]|uniref:Cysteine repeat modular protein 3 n=1 Tax=Plasmodium gonderi TaxID=77519 RepID=A0A1Y1JMW0_PLAGO|nr:cysteine repeat modular protein 3 [Plasmodium gonderi]GAW82815.1 cysteine repeat modular protein 3 [Plasmodium gonderi]